ncbi:MAG TPA: methionine synthase [Nitrospiria bacterium]|nr:methionine synthase [Nitrospiria bacterium]
MDITKLKHILSQRILVIDGAMGTQIQNRNLAAKDFGGPLLEGCNENLNLTRPDVIQSIHEAYLEAGADIVETNTFGGTSIVLAEYGLQDKVLEINRAGARLARAAADRFSTPDRPRLVAGAMGPTTKTLLVTGGVTFDQLTESFYLQTKGLIEGGADLLLLETAQDTLNLKAAAIGVLKALKESGRELPLMISATIERTGTMLAGQAVEALYTSLEHLPLFSIGLNCATGPEFMTDHLRSLAALATCYISVYPNAGLPDEEGKYSETPESLSTKLARFADEGWLNLVGGCCGTTPEHIKAIAGMVKGKKPRVPQTTIKPAVSGIDYLPIEEDNRPIIVGERTNVIGSRKFKDLIVSEKIEEAAEVGRAQVKTGAQVLDVCMANPDRNELSDMDRFIQIVNKKVKAPIMIDSTDAAVTEAALKHCQGKCVVNSINLEDGEERFEKIVPLIQKYGGAVVVGCIDEDKVQGMAVTRVRKVAVAKRSFDLLVNKYGLQGRDIIFDALVFPVGTGDANYIGSAPETIEGIRMIKEALPGVKTILGISNVSFGLPPAGREVLNAVFLYHCVKAGLDYAIVNSEKLERYPSIPEEERRLAEDLIYWRGKDPVAAFAEYFRAKKPAVKKPKTSLSLDERLARYIIEGSKDGLIEDLDEARKNRSPLEIINGPLMAGMDEVGRLFNNNELIVAEVLQSAEAMKAAVRHLEQFMEKSDTASRGKIILATVKGDVHDIGKNLVEIILGNNGYKIVNLGIKVPPEELIAAYRREQPDAIGLSGLLVKSAQQMVVTAQDLRAAGISAPILVGGAALTKKFTDTKIAAEYSGPVIYAKDAMNGLDIANQLMNEDSREDFLNKVREDREHMVQVSEERASRPATVTQTAAVRSAVRRDHPLPSPPDFDLHVVDGAPVHEIFGYINPVMLYGKHLGLKGNLEKLLAEKDETAVKLYKTVEAFKKEAVAKKYITAQGVYRFFPCRSRGEVLFIYDPSDPSRVVETFTFPRQASGERLCLSDYCRDVESGETDSVAFFAVTCGRGVRKLSTQWKEAGDYLRSHMLQAVAVEGAEGFAEWLHKKIRADWGFPDPPSLALPDLFHKKYRGVRVSFGYPACPNLADQHKLFKLLDVAAKIGVQLTDGDMMDPEASVSALVFHHPEAKYFRTDTA